MSATKSIKILGVLVLAAGVSMTALVARRQRDQQPICGNQPCVETPPTDPQLAAGIAGLRERYVEAGYFWVFVGVQNDKNRVATYTVSPGDIYHFDGVTILGATNDWVTDFQKLLPLHSGDIYKPSIVKAWIDPLTQPRGSFSAPVAASLYAAKRLTINTDRQKHTISLVLEVAKRPIGAETTVQ